MQTLETYALEYARIAQSEPKSMILHIEGRSNKYCNTVRITLNCIVKVNLGQ